MLTVPSQQVVYASHSGQGDVLSIRRNFWRQQVPCKQQVGKPISLRRLAEERQPVEYSQAIRRCRRTTRPSLIQHKLADIEVEAIATLLPPATRQFLPGLENYVGRRSRG